MKKLIDIVCDECGSNDLLFDAFAYWDAHEQEFKLANTFPEKNVYCDRCDKYDVKTKEINLDNSNK